MKLFAIYQDEELLSVQPFADKEAAEEHCSRMGDGDQFFLFRAEEVNDELRTSYYKEYAQPKTANMTYLDLAGIINRMTPEQQGSDVTMAIGDPHCEEYEPEYYAVNGVRVYEGDGTLDDGHPYLFSTRED